MAMVNLGGWWVCPVSRWFNCSLGVCRGRKKLMTPCVKVLVTTGVDTGFIWWHGLKLSFFTRSWHQIEWSVWLWSVATFFYWNEYLGLIIDILFSLSENVYMFKKIYGVITWLNIEIQTLLHHIKLVFKQGKFILDLTTMQIAFLSLLLSIK